MTPATRSLKHSNDVRFPFTLDGEETETGEWSSHAAPSTSRFELARMRCGRHGWEEITELDWTDDLGVIRRAFFEIGFLIRALLCVKESTLSELSTNSYESAGTSWTIHTLPSGSAKSRNELNGVRFGLTP